jgi:glutamate-ammonia-ligase adenylyltransferase
MDRATEKVNQTSTAELFPPDLRGLAGQIAAMLGDGELADSILTKIRERSPDDRLAMAFLLRLGEAPSNLSAQDLTDDSRRDDLLFCLGASEMIGTGLLNAGPEWISLFDGARGVGFAPNSVASVRSSVSLEDLAARKKRVMLAIAIADVLERAQPLDTMRAMSVLADDCINAALKIAARELELEPIAERFCVIALGKLGARELNLSSDIDLSYIVDDDGRLDLQEQTRRLGERLTEIISGRCFRVDLRLRPGGSRAPLISSFEGALGFYQSFGQTWERAALLRARPIAGARSIGEQLIGELRNFIYRAYLDFDTIRDLRAMKQQIEDELRSPELVRRNIKLGYGGIRELEFIVQALALIYGGRDPRLRTANTIEALHRLKACGYLDAGHADELSAAYLTLRNVEHKLQVAAGLQTHTLPSDHADLAILAARLGFGKSATSVEGFVQELDRTRELVSQSFRETLGSDQADRATAVSDAALTAWRSAANLDQAGAALSQLGFAHPEESAVHLELLVYGPRHLPPTERRRESIKQLGPLMLDEMSKLPDPDLVLRNLASFFAAVGARTSYLALLQQHPAIRQMLMRLFASSDYLSGLFIRHPEVIDTLVRSDVAAIRRDPAPMASELHDRMRACVDFEQRLDAIRSFRHQEFLRIAIADLAGELQLQEVEQELSNLAQIVVSEGLRWAQIETAEKRALPDDLKLCVIAMGRLGAGEMTYNSDLDLIFVYYLPEEIAASGLMAASRIVQKLIAILEAPTREGYAYKIDLRLRPSGNAGPLVTSLEGFHAYHAQSSALWERQSLVRARVIAGDRALADEIELARRKFVYELGLDAAGVAEIKAMRMRIERELGQETSFQLNLKHGPGGLLDVEFLTQMMALRYGRDHPELRVRSIVAMVHAITGAGLLPKKEAEQLEQDFYYLSRLENRLRIESDQAATALPRDPDRLLPIARRMGFTGSSAASDLLTHVELRRKRIRELFDSCFAREAAIH